MTTQLSVIGVYHQDDDSDFKKVLGYVRHNFNRGQKVSLEYSGPPEELLSKEYPYLTKDHRFWRKVAKALKGKGVNVETVEDIELYERQTTNPNEKEQKKLSLRRSVSLRNLAIENGSNALITGALHAYDIQRLQAKGVLNGCEIVLPSEIDEHDKHEREMVIEEYLQNI